MHHDYVKGYLLRRLDDSERAMSRFYSRWRAQEMKLQAYVDLPEYEQILKDASDSGKPPKSYPITLPYNFFTVSTIVNYLMHVFTGRNPMFSVGTYDGENFSAAQKMEIMLQYNADATRLSRELYHFIHDSQVYGVGALMTQWKIVRQERTRYETVVEMGPTGPVPASRPTRKNEVVYEGNDARALDPFRLFPDARVPMERVNKDGEYIFWRLSEGLHSLKKKEAAGFFMWVDAGAHRGSSGVFTYQGGESARGMVSGGEPHAGNNLGGADSTGIGQSNVQVDQGSIDIIPRELGLGPSEVPEKWIFTILNRSQIVQADKLDLDHGMHPVVITEPYSSGYSFGNVGITDMLGPLQDAMSFLVNSHFDNVRKVMNDMLIVNPSLVEMGDLKRPGPGRLIRLKTAAFGRDVREAIHQLQVTDVTKEHIRDASLFMQIGEKISAVTENILGVQDTGGRKTATETRVASGAAVSRLAGQAKIISAQAITDLTEQWAVNIQQLQSPEFAMKVVGQMSPEEQIIRPQMLVGNFHYPIHDGTMPLDKIAMLDQWRQLFAVVLQDPMLRQSYNVPKMFEFIAELGGARNIEAMRINAMPDAQLAAQAQAGNVIPISQARGMQGGGNTGQVNAVPGQPGNRLAGAA